MLTIKVPPSEYFDEESGTFFTAKETVLQLEHSLISLAKWESKWKKPFLGKERKTPEQMLDYVRCMTLTQNVNPWVYGGLTTENFERINRYIDDPMTATWFREDRNRRPGREVITAEIIYYWMIALNIPSEYQKWHLNRLLTLIRVCNEKNAPQRKMSRREVLAWQRAQNEARKRRLHTRG